MAVIPSNYGAAVNAVNGPHPESGPPTWLKLCIGAAVIYGGGWCLIKLGHCIRNAYDDYRQRRLRRKNYGE